MAEARDHSYFVYQDIDLKDNDLKNVTNISSSSDLNLSAGVPDSTVNPPIEEGNIVFKNPSDFRKKVDFNEVIHVKKQPTSGGTFTYPEAHFDGNVLIGETATDRSKNLTVAGVKIYWDIDSNSLIFEKQE